MIKEYCVYMHRFPNGKVYIGITSQEPEQRWRGGDGYKNQAVYRAIRKYGWGNVLHDVLLQGLTKAQAEQAEIGLISLYHSNEKKYGYNVDNGGNCYGTHSAETRAKIAQSNRTRTLSEETHRRMSEAQKGKKMTEDAKRKIGLAFKGRVLSDDHRKKIGEAQKGKVLSSEQRRKISESRKGLAFKCNNPEERGRKLSRAMKERNANRPEVMEKMRNASVAKCSKRILQKTLSGEEIAVWKSAAEIERILGFGHSQISRACKNRSPYNGYSWCFYD